VQRDVEFELKARESQRVRVWVVSPCSPAQTLVALATRTESGNPSRQLTSYLNLKCVAARDHELDFRARSE
jgi:hypothetical protein